jgi:restriction system protein
MNFISRSFHGQSRIDTVPSTASKGSELLNAAAAHDLFAISAWSRNELERRVVAAYRHRGYQVVAPEGAAAEPDAGLLLTAATQRLLLQCKYWKTRKLAELPVRELFGMMAAQGATAGMLITSGSFTLEASRFAGFGRIQLLDASRLLALLRQTARE